MQVLTHKPEATSAVTPLRIAFLLTTMPVGGAETLLVDLVRRMDRNRFAPSIVCLKELDVLGRMLSSELPTASGFLRSKFDLRVLPRLTTYLREQDINAVVTVGAGDKMFWGRLAARRAGVPVVISALHSTGWPDGIGRLNRLLTPITDAFVAVAAEHGRFLREAERLPEEKVCVIPNGVDMNRFERDLATGNTLRQMLQIPLDAPVCGIVAALRPEKNHRMFLEVAAAVQRRFPDSHFLVVGDGPEMPALVEQAARLRLSHAVHFLGTRSDVPALLNAMNVLLLTSHNEANPVSILEGLATELPVVATRVGSVSATVIDDQTGYLVEPGDVTAMAARVTELLANPGVAAQFGEQGRELVAGGWSVDRMVEGYEQLIEQIYQRKQLY